MTQDKTDDERLYDAQDALAALLGTKPSKIGQRGKVLELTVEQAEQLLRYVEQQEMGSESDRSAKKDQARSMGLMDGRKGVRPARGMSIYRAVVGCGPIDMTVAAILADAYDQGYDMGSAGGVVPS